MAPDQEDRDTEYKVAWSKAFPASNSGTLEEMAQFFDSPWPAVRARVLRALGRRGMAEAVPRLIEAAEREEDDSVRLAIALALADLEDPRAADTLWALFESGTVPIRQAALQGLGRLGDDRIIPVAMAWCTSQDRLSRAIGAFDLALLQTARGEEALSELLAAEPSWRRRRSIQRSIRRARRWRSNHRR